jgi:hypothetical protein
MPKIERKNKIKQPKLFWEVKEIKPWWQVVKPHRDIREGTYSPKGWQICFQA